MAKPAIIKQQTLFYKYLKPYLERNAIFAGSPIHNPYHMWNEKDKSALDNLTPPKQTEYALSHVRKILGGSSMVISDRLYGIIISALVGMGIRIWPTPNDNAG